MFDTDIVQDQTTTQDEDLGKICKTLQVQDLAEILPRLTNLSTIFSCLGVRFVQRKYFKWMHFEYLSIVKGPHLMITQ